MKTGLPSRPALPPPLAKLFDELRVDHAFGPVLVEQMHAAATDLDREADDNLDAENLLQALSLVASQRRPARDRITDIFELIEARGRVVVRIAL
jgi:hypothetical protein